MGKYSQSHQPLALTTPLGPHTLLLARLAGSEEISRLFHFDLDLLAEGSLAPRPADRPDWTDGRGRLRDLYLAAGGPGDAVGYLARSVGIPGSARRERLIIRHSATSILSSRRT